MFEGLRSSLAVVDWNALLERGSNDKIVAFFTQPLGLGALAVVLIASLLLKWRLTFVVIAGALGVACLARYTLTGNETGPGKGMFFFAGGAVAIAAFVIYFLFIREE